MYNLKAIFTSYFVKIRSLWTRGAWIGHASSPTNL